MVIAGSEESFYWDPSSGIPAFTPWLKSPPKRRGKNQCRDQKRDVQMASRCGLHPKQIAVMLKLTERQVRYALATPATPKKPTGRPPVLGPNERQILVDFVCSSKAARRMDYKALASEFNYMDWGWEAIKNALDKEGYGRRWAMRKPPISEKNRKLRLKFAQAHKDWTTSDWYKFLWSDETWVTDGRHRKTMVMRRPGEEWDETCIEEKVQRKKGWMFWGSFHGNTKGPAFFWEKDWGKISGPTYRERCLPLLAQYLCDIGGLKGEPEELLFMQDNAPGHAAKETIALLEQLCIITCKWPPYSPDLNPIETLWKYMKEYLQSKYGDFKFKSYEQQRERITEAWHVVAVPGFMHELLEGMQDRMQAVIDAKGKFIKY